MFHHVTLIRFRDDAPAAALHAALTQARELPGRIAQIRSMSCGPAEAAPAHDYDLAYEFAFDDEADFTGFAAHAAHAEFVEHVIHPWADQVTSIDYEDDVVVAARPRRAR